MIVSAQPKIRMIHRDSSEAMKCMADNAYELAIIDPPYGISVNKFGNGRRRGAELNYKIKGDWDNAAPNSEWFSELFRVSKNQILWGANHYITRISKNSSGWVFWDKGQPVEVSFASGELAWTSFSRPLKRIKIQWRGAAGMRYGEKRIHPTQKPVALYKWLLKEYAKPGDKILDTHGGSGSIAIACYDMGFDLDWYELDQDYYETAVARFKEHKKQGQLFTPRQTYQPVQTKLEIS